MKKRDQELASLREAMEPLKNGVKRPYALSAEVLRARLEAAEDARILIRRMPRWAAPLASAVCVLAVAFGSFGVWNANFKGGFSSGAAVDNAAALATAEEYAMDVSDADTSPAPEEAPAAAGGMAGSPAPDMDGGVADEKGSLLKSTQNPETACIADDTDAAPAADPAETDDEDIFADWSVEPDGGNGPVVSDGMLYYTGAPDGVTMLYAAKADGSGEALEAVLPGNAWPQGLYASGNRVAVAAQVYGGQEERAEVYLYCLTEDALTLEHVYSQTGSLMAVRQEGETLAVFTASDPEVRWSLDGAEAAAEPMDAPYPLRGAVMGIGRLTLDGTAQAHSLAGGAAQFYVSENNVYAGFVSDGKTDIMRVHADGGIEPVGTVPVEVEWSSCYHERDGVLYVTPQQGGVYAFGLYNGERGKAN